MSPLQPTVACPAPVALVDDASDADEEHDDAAAWGVDEWLSDGALLVPHDGILPPRRRIAGSDDDVLAALILRTARQEPRALEALYDRTSSRVYGLVLRITQHASLAEEVVEDTFWQVWRQASRYDSARGRPLTWLLAMARSRAIDALRRDQRFQHDALPDEGVAEEPDPAAPAPDLLDATHGAGALHEALATLDARARQLVALAFFRGLTHDEIANREGLPLGSVKSIIRRALIQLRKSLEGSHDAR